MRAYKLGEFPSKNALAFEETINGSMAYRILLGERPLMYPVRYLDAVGLWFFGETTFGLRFFGIAMSIATVPVFYLLLRQLVRVPVALFGTALLAAAYWPSLVNRETSATTFFTMLLAYLLISGLRNHSALAFMGVGFLAGLISYEYEDIKPVPFYVLGFLGAIAVWQVGGAARRGWRPARDAILSILRKAWRPALAFAVAGGIVAGPLIMGTHLGKDLYLSSLHRQEGDRKARNTPGLLAPNWEQQVRWSVQLFRPLSPGPPKSRVPLSVPDIPVLESDLGNPAGIGGRLRRSHILAPPPGILPRLVCGEPGGGRSPAVELGAVEVLEPLARWLRAHGVPHRRPVFAVAPAQAESQVLAGYSVHSGARCRRLRLLLER